MFLYISHTITLTYRLYKMCFISRKWMSESSYWFILLTACLTSFLYLRQSLCGLGSPGIHSVDQAGLMLKDAIWGLERCLSCSWCPLLLQRTRVQFLAPTLEGSQWPVTPAPDDWHCLPSCDVCLRQGFPWQGLLAWNLLGRPGWPQPLIDYRHHLLALS